MGSWDCICLPFKFWKSYRKSNLLNIIMRMGQMIIGIMIIVWYMKDLSAAKKQQKYSDGRWVFAVVVGSASLFTAFFYALMGIWIQYRAVAVCFAWDWILTVSYAVLSGIFGKMYAHEKVEMDSDIRRMKNAMNADFAGLVFWFITAVCGTLWFFTEPMKVSHRGREKAEPHNPDNPGY